MEHDYQNARRGAVLSSKGKTRITMYLDDDVLTYFRNRAVANGRGYQTEINASLRNLMHQNIVISTGESNFVSLGRDVAALGFRKRCFPRRNVARMDMERDRTVKHALFAGGGA